MLRILLLRDGFVWRVMEAVDEGKGLLLAGGWLIVWCFRLDLAHEDILCVYELILIQRVVLDRCTDARGVNAVG